MLVLLFGALFSLLITWAALPLLRRWITDVPNARSSHSAPTPRGGGIAVLVATVIALLVAVDAPPAWKMLLPALGVGLVGLADDVRSLSILPRLLAQFLAAVLVVLLVMDTWGSAGLPETAFVVVATLGVVAFVNAFNFMDGVNGISALNACLGGVWFGWLLRDSETWLGAVGLALVGAALGFLAWNLAGRVFLGDVGSYGIGALVATLAVIAWASGEPALVAVAPLLVYFVDTGTVIVRRLLSGRSLTEAHREHAYQRLVQHGWSHLASGAWTAGVGGLVCLVVATTYDSRPLLAATLVAATLVVYLLSPHVVGRLQSRTVTG